MTQKRAYLLITFIFLSLSTYSQNWGDYFTWTEVDSLHACPSKIAKGKELNSGLVANTGLDTIYPYSTFYGNQSFKWGDSLYAFIVRLEAEESEQPIVLLVLANKQSEIKHYFEIASYATITGTMEETRNSWIYDLDKDGDLDIVIMDDLVDYELPIEGAPNISGVEGRVYRNTGTDFSYEYISKELYYQLMVIK
jgi:hypothetical protein